MVKSPANLIWLDLAYLSVEAHLEEGDGVPIEERLGSPADAIPRASPPEPPAGGPLYKKQFTSMPQPTRGGGPPYAPPATVPPLPDRWRLCAMRQDDAQSHEDTFPAEKRACRVDRFFSDALRSGRIKMWAEDVIVAPDDSWEVVIDRHTPLLFDLWKDCEVDYRNAAAFPPGDDWVTRVDGHRVEGLRVLRNLVVDEDALEAELTGWVVSTLSLHSVAGDEIWKIDSNGTVIEVRCGVNEEALSRGMRVFAMALKHAGTSLPHSLLEGLGRRKYKQEKKFPKDKEVARLRRLIDPTCSAFFWEDRPLREANEEIRKILAGRTSEVLPTQGDFTDRAYDAVNNSLEAVRAYLRRRCGKLGSVVANHIKASIRSRNGGFFYDPRRSQVAWTWAPPPPSLHLSPGGAPEDVTAA